MVQSLRVLQRRRKKRLTGIGVAVGAMSPIGPNAIYWRNFHDPGSPWQNARIESFNGRLRDELLNAWRFDSLLEARVIIEDWRRDYNVNRPDSAHGELTPAEFALQCSTTHQPRAA